MIRTGRVADVQGDRMRICFERPEECARCGACSGQKEHALVELIGDAPLGALVEVDIPEKRVLLSSLIAYGIPLLLLLSGVALGAAAGSEALGAGLGLAAMAGAYLILRRIEKRLGARKEWQPKIIRIIKEEKEDGSEADKG